MNVIAALSSARDTRLLTSASYLPDPSGFMLAGINEALAYINRNLTGSFDEKDLAEIAGLSPAAFSRSFRRHTGLALVKYVNRLRINLACPLRSEGHTSELQSLMRMSNAHSRLQKK